MIRHPARPSRLIPALLLAVAAVGLSGCAGEPAPTPTSAPPSASASAEPSPSAPAAPALNPDGTAAENLAFFRTIVQQVWGTEAQGQGRAYVDALVAAGFDKGAMQVTNDTSTVGNPAESIQFSVLWGDQCLVGQVGPATGEPFATVVPAVEGGTCLIGKTRPIDW